MRKTRLMNLRTYLIGFVIAGSVLTSCAWLQKHESQINCATIATVENAPQLITIVTTCTTIAATNAAILPCIRAAAGSQWKDDVIACFAGAAAGLTSCPALPPSAPSTTSADRDRLRAALRTQGYTFK